MEGFDIGSLLGGGAGGGSTSKEFGRSSAASSVGDSSVGVSDVGARAWLWPAVALGGLLILGLVLVAALRK